MKIPYSTTAVLLFATSVAAFVPVPKSSQHVTKVIHSRTNRYGSLAMTNQFDVSRPVVDLLSLRTVRGDALVRYNALNQSEPLRISLYFLLAIGFFAAPSLSESVGYDDMNLPTSIVSYAIGLSSVGLFVRECSRRSKQLNRIEKELRSESLMIRLPMNQLSEVPYTRPTTLQNLRKLSNAPRIIAVSGNKAKLNEALTGLSVLGRRLQQASVFVVPIPTDGCKVSDLEIFLSSQSTKPWLASADNQDIWRSYFSSLTGDDDVSESSSSVNASFQWFGLTSSGRSFGSGEEEVPIWLQILGQHLRPTDILDETDPPLATTNTSLLEPVRAFYSCLTNGDLIGIEAIFSSKQSSQVAEVISAGGRLDSWKDCLADGARPEGMKISGVDSTVISDTEAYTTVIEFPATAGIDSATLLAVQRWTRQALGDDWKLELHQTIPWSPGTKAQGTLMCDCEGCVALTRGPERRTFGGMVG